MGNYLYYLLEDLGDGSSAVRWFKTYEDAEAYLEGPNSESLWANDDGVQVLDLNNIRYTENDNG